MKLLNVSINLSKINRDKIFDGKKGKYLNLTVQVKDEQDEFGNDVAAWQGQTKEEREAKADRNYLGNGKTVYESKMNEQPNEPKGVAYDEDMGDLPF